MSTDPKPICTCPRIDAAQFGLYGEGHHYVPGRPDPNCNFHGGSAPPKPVERTGNPRVDALIDVMICPTCRTIYNAQKANCSDLWHSDNRPEPVGSAPTQHTPGAGWERCPRCGETRIMHPVFDVCMTCAAECGWDPRCEACIAEDKDCRVTRDDHLATCDPGRRGSAPLSEEPAGEPEDGAR